MEAGSSGNESATSRTGIRGPAISLKQYGAWVRTLPRGVCESADRATGVQAKERRIQSDDELNTMGWDIATLWPQRKGQTGRRGVLRMKRRDDMTPDQSIQRLVWEQLELRLVAPRCPCRTPVHRSRLLSSRRAIPARRRL